MKNKKLPQPTPFEVVSFNIEKMSNDILYALAVDVMIKSSTEFFEKTPDHLTLKEVLSKNKNLGNLLLADSIMKEALMISA